MDQRATAEHQPDRDEVDASPDGTAFAAQLRRLMNEKKISVATLAQNVQDQLPGKKFNSANISHYRSGRSTPRPAIMAALAKALDVDVDSLVATTRPESRSMAPSGRARATPRSRAAAQPRPLAVPHEAAPARDDDEPVFHVQDLKDGGAWIQINQRLPWSMVIKLLQVLKGEPDDGSTG